MANMMRFSTRIGRAIIVPMTIFKNHCEFPPSYVILELKSSMDASVSSYSSDFVVPVVPSFLCIYLHRIYQRIFHLLKSISCKLNLVYKFCVNFIY